MITYYTLSKKYDEQVRTLYKRNNDLMNVHPVFTEGVLNEELKVPSDTYPLNLGIHCQKFLISLDLINSIDDLVPS